MSDEKTIKPERPWVTPEEVKAYSELKTVQQRADNKLAIDISRAEQYVISYTHNTFEGLKTIPEPVKTAVLILSEAYGNNAVEASKDQFKSETFDDYSYTRESGLIDISLLDLGYLLDEWLVAQPTGKVTMRMRKL